MEPFARVLGRVGLTPNALTLIGFGIACLAAAAAAGQAWLVAGLLVVFGAVFDLFDGALARATNTTSRLGAFMDSTFDRAGEAVVYIGIAIGLVAVMQPADGFVRLGDLVHRGVPVHIGPLVAVTAMAAAFMVSYTRAKSESLGFTSGSGMANIGVAPREVRVAILAIALLLAGIGEPVAARFGETYWWWTLVASLALIAVLATITTIQRILHVVRQSREQEN